MDGFQIVAELMVLFQMDKIHIILSREMEMVSFESYPLLKIYLLYWKLEPSWIVYNR